MIQIHSLQTGSSYDGPGRRTVFFLQGCKFACKYCSNPDTWSLQGGKKRSTQQVVDKVLAYKNYYGDDGGVTFSGGECTLQAEELIPICQQVKDEDISVCIDTNGSQLNDDVKQLLKYTDLVLLDIKHTDPSKHLSWAGAALQPVLRFRQYLESIGQTYRVRHVVVPGYTDGDEHITALGELLEDTQHMERLELLPYHRLGLQKWKELGRKYALEDVVEPSTAQMKKLVNRLAEFGIVVNVR